jgi:tRNA(Ile2) C34 agmatinyltransferase TiaS
MTWLNNAEAERGSELGGTPYCRRLTPLTQHNTRENGSVAKNVA